jgi:Zn-finger nucleic acid-binding protein
MLCPVDKSALETHQEVTAQALFCRTCHGIWFSREHLAAFLRSASGTKPLPRKKVFSQKSPLSASERLCPSCESIDLSPRVIDGVEIDVCPTCSGVWLDAGELELIVTRFRRKQKMNALSDNATDIFSSDPTILADLTRLIIDAMGKSAEWAGEAAPALLDFIADAFSSIDF